MPLVDLSNHVSIVDTNPFVLSSKPFAKSNLKPHYLSNSSTPAQKLGYEFSQFPFSVKAETILNNSQTLNKHELICTVMLYDLTQYYIGSLSMVEYMPYDDPNLDIPETYRWENFERILNHLILLVRNEYVYDCIQAKPHLQFAYFKISELGELFLNPRSSGVMARVHSYLSGLASPDHYAMNIA